MAETPGLRHLGSKELPSTVWQPAVRSPQAAPKDGFHVLWRAYASLLSGARESLATVARWFGHSPPAITLGYYAHFMPEAGREGRTALDGPLGRAGRAVRRPILPRFSPGLIGGDSGACTTVKPTVDSKENDPWGLGKR